MDEVIGIPICLALYLSLRRTHESLMLMATALAAVSLVCYLVAIPALSMLYLSRQYAAATVSVEREGLLAAGQAVLASWLGTPCQVGYVVGSIQMLLVGWVMLGSKIFGKTAGWVGILAGIVSFGFYVPKVGVFISLASVVGMQVWYVMIAWTLFRLSGEHGSIGAAAGSAMAERSRA